jgi:hypothetical protein
MTNRLFYGDNLDVLREHIRDESVDLIYLDPEMATRAWGCLSFPINRSGQLGPAGPPHLSTATGPTTITGPPFQRPPVCAVGVGPHLTSDYGRHSGQPLAAKPSPPAP